jgi:GNAT superfamily N-acetyltransferase
MSEGVTGGMKVHERFKVGISRYRPSDADDLAEFQRRAFGADSRQLDRARFEWLYGRNPAHHDDDPGVWICRRGGAVVGQQAEIGFDVKVGAEQHPAVWAVDLMVEPEWRIKGIGPGLVDTHLQQRPLVAGITQSDDAVKVYERFDWTDVGTVPSYLRPLDLRRTFQVAPIPARVRRLGAVFAPALRIVDAVLAVVLRLAGLRLTRVARFDERIDEVWVRSAPDYPVLACRDAAHVRWRFDECPEADELQRYYLTRRGRTLGYVVLRPDERWGRPASLVIDYLSPVRWVAPMLTCAAHEARRQGAFALVCRTLNRSADRRLRLSLFIRRGMDVAAPLRLVMRCTAPVRCAVFGDADAWLLTAADSDLS